MKNNKKYLLAFSLVILGSAFALTAQTGNQGTGTDQLNSSGQSTAQPQGAGVTPGTSGSQGTGTQGTGAGSQGTGTGSQGGTMQDHTNQGGMDHGTTGSGTQGTMKDHGSMQNRGTSPTSPDSSRSRMNQRGNSMKGDSTRNRGGNSTNKMHRDSTNK